MEAKAISPEQGRSLILRFQRDPVAHIEDVQGVTTLEAYQKRVVEAIRDNERVAIAASHDVGKTWTMAKVVIWFLTSFPGAKVITTAPTFNLVEKLLWSEIRAGVRLSKYPLGGRVLNTEWKIRDDWFAIGLSPKDDADSDGGQGKSSSFQGVHAEYVLIIFDEATGIPPKRWMQAEGMMTSGHVRWAAIGNPTSSSSQFAACFKSRAWHKIYLSCFDSPNLIASGITDIEKLRAEIDLIRAMPEAEADARIRGYPVMHPKLLTIKWVIERALEWGIEHPLFVSKVLGQFPGEDDHVLMPLGAVEAAQLRDAVHRDSDRYSIGVDVARFGSDKSVITVMRGAAVIGRRVLIKQKTTSVSGEVLAELRGLKSRNVVIVVDGTGIGSGVVDELEEAVSSQIEFRGVVIREVHFGEGFNYIQDREQREEDQKIYSNRKSKLFVRLASDLKQNVVLPQDSVYLEELPTIIYRFDSKGRYVIESKDEYKKRTGRPSPDDADSLALANEGRYELESVGTFTASMASASNNVAPIAPSKRSGEQW